MGVQRSWILPALFTLLCIAVGSASVIFCWESGTLVVLTLTLIAIVWYTYFTYQLWAKKEDAIVIASIHYIPERKDVRVIAHNPTRRYAAARLTVRVVVNGEETDLGSEYQAKTIWHLTPKFTIDGHFSINKPIQQKEKTFDLMVKEANEENYTKQLRLFLKVKWEDEEGRPGEYPEHAWYFDFRKNGFVYEVGGFSEG